MDTPLVVVFSRMPRPGKAKTRLIPSLGAAGAAQLQRRMTGHTVLVARQAAAVRGASLEVRYADGSARQMRNWLGRGPTYRPQLGTDLGERMAEAFRRGFLVGHRNILIIGTDCPGITAEVLSAAINALDSSDLVLGPATDGGYYLVGLRKDVPQLFDGISWSTDKVFRQTIQAAESSGLSVAQLESLGDVDRPEDLQVWTPFAADDIAADVESRISVVIPALNEGAAIATAVESAAPCSNIDVTVVDGGSRDNTVEIAKKSGAKVVNAAAGRGGQMNAGVTASSGDVLVFLHADAQLPMGYETQVRSILSRPSTSAGAFHIRIAGDGRGTRTMERLINFRSRHFAMPYGDQGIFVSRKVFQAAGGYSTMAIMEDYEFMQRMRRIGDVVLADASVTVSDRRWSRMGVFRTTVINQLMILGYRLGISPKRLAASYAAGRGEGEQ